MIKLTRIKTVSLADTRGRDVGFGRVIVVPHWIKVLRFYLATIGDLLPPGTPAMDIWLPAMDDASTTRVFIVDTSERATVPAHCKEHLGSYGCLHLFRSES